MAALSFFTLLPVIQRSAETSSQETLAIQISSRLIEHIQMLNPTDCNAATLSSLNLIDNNQTSSPFYFSNIPLDNGSNYSPSKCLPSGQGLLTITDLGGGSVLCQVKVLWRGTAGTKTYTTATILGGYR
jgi:hypothetical protein